MKKPIIALILAAVLLFAVNTAVREAGFENSWKAHQELLQTLLPGATEFTVVEFSSGEDIFIRSVHEADQGFVIEVSTQGYADEITMLIGVNREGKVTGLVVRDAYETPGLGGRVLTDHEFLAQFLNKSDTFKVITDGSDAFSGATDQVEPGQGKTVPIDAITGATVTSKAVTRCVNAAVAYVTGVDAVTEATSWGG
ncbi:MAG: FMN-binding protein [Ruminococcaceae bacterium]|nr:FMN-binding protein [Oscillospiraceae bacterium]